MPRPSNPVPTYQRHKPSGQAYVRLPAGPGRRRVVYLGKYNTPESRDEYRRVVAELEHTTTGAPRPTERGTDLTVNELLVAYLGHAVVYYRDPSGRPTSEVDQIKRSVGPARELYGHRLVAEFTPMALEAVRARMIAAALSRSLINKRIDRVKRVFRWGVSKGLVPVGVYEALRTLGGLRAGRSAARESEPVKPVAPEQVAATLPFLNRHAAAMVELQRFTGMRPGEVCAISLGQIDRTAAVWLYRPERHKTAHRGKERVVPLGPKAQAVVVKFLSTELPTVELPSVDPVNAKSRQVAAVAYRAAGRSAEATLLSDLGHAVQIVAGRVIDPAAPLFSPKVAREERYRALRARRKSKVPPSQQNRRSATPRRPAAEAFTPVGYAKAVAWGARRAGVGHWHPNQLRHLLATEVRRAFGLEAAQVVLGHSHAAITQVYAERDLNRAVDVAARVG